MNANSRFMVIGNDSTVNSIDFNKLKRTKNLITIGVNRIWHKFMPNILFFVDAEIVQEIMEVYDDCDLNCYPINLDRMCRCRLKDCEFMTVRRKCIKYPAIMKFLSTVKTNFIECKTSNSVFGVLEYICHNSIKSTIYIAGVSLKWSKDHHFWKNEKRYNIYNDKGAQWYNPRFKKALDNIVRLHWQFKNLISVNPKSALNKHIPYFNIELLYRDAEDELSDDDNDTINSDSSEDIDLEKNRQEQLRLMQERIEKERIRRLEIEKELAEKERILQEKLEKERLEKERLMQERIEHLSLEDAIHMTYVTDELKDVNEDIDNTYEIVDAEENKEVAAKENVEKDDIPTDRKSIEEIIYVNNDDTFHFNDSHDRESIEYKMNILRKSLLRVQSK